MFSKEDIICPVVDPVASITGDIYLISVILRTRLG